MEFHELLHEREADASPAESALVRTIHLVEPLKDVLQLRRRDPDPRYRGMAMRSRPSPMAAETSTSISCPPSGLVNFNALEIRFRTTLLNNLSCSSGTRSTSPGPE